MEQEWGLCTGLCLLGLGGFLLLIFSSQTQSRIRLNTSHPAPETGTKHQSFDITLMASGGCGFTSLQHCQVLSHRDFSAGGRCDDQQPWRQEPSVHHSQHARRCPHFLVLQGNGKGESQPPQQAEPVTNRLQEILISGNPQGVSAEGQQEGANQPPLAPAEGQSSL